MACLAAGKLGGRCHFYVSLVGFLMDKYCGEKVLAYTCTEEYNLPENERTFDSFDKTIEELGDE